MLLTLDEALAIVADKIKPLNEANNLALADALGYVSAQDVVAPYALPPFTNTGVDGYAFSHAAGQSVFKLVGASFAGEPLARALKTGEAARIATGAVLPEGADTVVMQEVCTIENDVLTLSDIPAKGANLRLMGDDIQKGAVAVAKGQTMRPQEIALLAALDIQRMDVIRPVKVAVISTGMELRASGESQSAGRIVDTNTLMLKQLLERPSVQVTCLPPLPDAHEATRHALLEAASRYDVVITTGGVSVGDRDFVRDVLHECGDVHFWNMAIRPGKPVIVGHIAGCVMVGLPGNPVSAYVTSLLIVRAVLRGLWGVDVQLPEGFGVALAATTTKPAHLRGFPRARHTSEGVVPYADQSSNLYTSLTHADGLLDLPIGQTVFEKGQTVIFRPFSLFL